MLPAHLTKHIKQLPVAIKHHSFIIYQSDDGTTNGSALWLGAQCLSLYLHDYAAKSRLHRPARVIELGSGVGLTSLLLAAQGCDVLATDISTVISSVLSATIRANTNSIHQGSIRVSELDWTVPPSSWQWSEDIIASPSYTMPSGAPQSTPPSFDLIVSSDTIYLSALVQPLWRTLHHLCTISATRPTIYICIERRDPALVDSAFLSAKSDLGFSVERVPHRKLVRAMKKTAINWEKDDWDGVEIWKLALEPQGQS